MREKEAGREGGKERVTDRDGEIEKEKISRRERER